MKKKCILYLIMMFVMDVYAQDDQQGIYLTETELYSGILHTVLLPSATIHEELDQVVVIDNAHKQKYKFGRIAGYRNAGVDYRSYGKTGFFQSYGYYKVINREGLFLYSRKVRGYKVSHVEYYYSLSLDSPIKRLLLKNLVHDFDKPQFTEAIMKFGNKDLRTQCRTGDYIINSIYTSIYSSKDRRY